MSLVAIPQLFAILSQANPEKVDAALAAHFPTNYLALAPGQWLLVAGGTTAKEISDRLGISTGESGSAVVITGTSYFGRSNPQIWEWLKSRLGTPMGNPNG